MNQEHKLRDSYYTVHNKKIIKVKLVEIRNYVDRDNVDSNVDSIAYRFVSVKKHLASGDLDGTLYDNLRNQDWVIKYTKEDPREEGVYKTADDLRMGEIDRTTRQINSY